VRNGSDTEQEYQRRKLANQTVAVIPAAGLSTRMTPLWTRVDPYLDSLAKPAMTDFVTSCSLLHLILTKLLNEGVVGRVWVRVGKRLPAQLEECRTEKEKMQFKIEQDLMAIIGRWDSVSAFYSNPDGDDEGTGATIVSREAKAMLEANTIVKTVVFCYGDTVTISSATLREIVLDHTSKANDVTVVSMLVPDASGYGRVVRDAHTNEFLGIVEQKVIGTTEEERREKQWCEFKQGRVKIATEHLQAIQERNTGLLVVTREVFLNTVRDVDVPAIGIAERQDKATAHGADHAERIYILKQRGKGEYYLPEVANKVERAGGKVEIFSLREGTLRAFDSRTDIRHYALEKEVRFEAEASPAWIRKTDQWESYEPLDERCFQVLEQLFGVSIYPGSLIGSDPSVRRFLLSLWDAIMQTGGYRTFSDRYEQELREGKLASVAHLNDRPSSPLHIGCHTLLKGYVALGEDISINPWATIENSAIIRSTIGRKAVIRNALIYNSHIRSSPLSPTLVESTEIRNATFPLY
jgi:hypothetical protein